MEVFDWRYYIGRYADLRDAGVLNKKKAISHWNKIGRFENRFPNKRVEEYHVNKKKQQNYQMRQNYYKNNMQNESSNNNVNSEISNKNDFYKEDSSSYSSFDNNPISLNEIKNIYSNAKIEFTKSENSSEFQGVNAGLIQENNNKINLLLNNLKVVYDEVLTIKNKVNNLEKKTFELGNSIEARESSLESLSSRKASKKESKKASKKKVSTGINQKIVSSDEYSDIEESEDNEIKYSNSDEFNNNNNDIQDEIIDGNFKNLNFHSTIQNKMAIPVDDVDKIQISKKSIKKETEIDSLIKDINIKDKVKKKQKKKKLVSLNEDSLSEESSETINDNLKEIDNIQHKSILNNILNNELEIEENKKQETKQKEGSILSYLKSQNEENKTPSFDNNKLNKLINNISSKKI